MSRPKRELKKKFIVFCEGDTEYHYIDQMRKTQGVEISIKPINMKGGGYQSFLDEIRTKAQTNCIAKFIIVDADRIQNGKSEKDGFLRLLDFCRIQNQKKAVPHFLIIDNPDFEYVACLHISDYKGQDTASYIKKQLGFGSVDSFKGKTDVYYYLNSGDNSYQNMLRRLAVDYNHKFLKNTYVVRKKLFDIEIKDTIVNFDHLSYKGSNIEEFFDVIEW
ncbi:MAG: RloB domain-containing protein [Lachnospiraceae bacterium]|nr:RloB domain-containing protein [Lachnospiraceae bacterium]